MMCKCRVRMATALMPEVEQRRSSCRMRRSGRGLSRHPHLNVLCAHLCVFCVLCGSNALRSARRVHGLSSPRPRTRRLAMTKQTFSELHQEPVCLLRSEEHSYEIKSPITIQYAVL